MRWGLFAVLMIMPWLSTFGGSMTACLFSKQNGRSQGALLGFAAGIMIAASIWSLIIPAFDAVGHLRIGFLIVTFGFFLGCTGMMLLDKIVPHQHSNEQAPEGLPSRFSRPMLLVTAIALHNIPEGLALGVVIAAAMGNSAVSWTASLMFGFGLALQNFPEGLAVTLPLQQSGVDRKRVFQLGLLSSLTEPAATVLGLLFTSALSELDGVIMPVLLATAAGAMMFIVVEQLIPESQGEENGHSPTYGFLIGFWVMALLGVFGA